jgi:hypothetical protein
MLKTQYILDFALKKFKNWTFIYFLIFNSRWATKIGTGLGNPKLGTGSVVRSLKYTTEGRFVVLIRVLWI